MTEYRMIYVTTPDRESAERISDTVIKEGLAACTNLIPGMESRYIWKGQMEVSQEFILWIKSDTMRWERLKTRILELHPYETPCILAIPIAEGSDAYLQWMTEAMS